MRFSNGLDENGVVQQVLVNAECLAIVRSETCHTVDAFFNAGRKIMPDVPEKNLKEGFAFAARRMIERDM